MPETTSFEQEPRLSFPAPLVRWSERRVVVLALCAAFTLLMLCSYIFPLGTVPCADMMHADCGQTVWSIWLASDAIMHGHNPYWSPIVYYPHGASLSHHTLVAGFFPVTLLVKILSGSDAMYPFYAYRIIVWLAFTLMLYGSYFLLRETRATRWAAAISAIAYTFCDFYMEHIVHLNILAGFFVPIVALFTVRLYKRPTPRSAVLTAALLACSIYFTEFILHICLAIAFMVLAICLFKRERAELLKKMRCIGVRGAALACVVFLLIVAPFLVNFAGDGVIKPIYDEHSRFSTNLAGLFIPNPVRTPLYGRLFAQLDAKVTKGSGGYEVFIGFPLLIFSILGMTMIRRRLARIVFIGALFFFALSLGPTLKAFGIDTGIELPYWLLMQMPPFDVGRTPVRFVVIAMCMMMIVGAHGMTWMQRALSERGGGRWSTAMMLPLFIWVTAETYSPAAAWGRSFTAPAQLENIVPGPVLNLPLSLTSAYGELMQIFHHQPVGAVYLARTSKKRLEQFAELEALYKEGGNKFCRGILDLGFRNVIIEPSGLSMKPLELSKCAINVVDLNERPVDYTLYYFGERLDFAAPESEPYLWHGWSTRETTSRWTEGNKAVIVFALDQVKPCVLRVKMGPFIVPGKLERQRVEIELNNQPLAKLVLDEDRRQIYNIDVPNNLLRDDNLLSFRMPDAASPQHLNLSDDPRQLGLSFEWLELAPQNSVSEAGVNQSP